LFAAADAAMYEAKRAGKNRVETAPDPVRQT
jgi:PleD family two-component response regulator